MAVPASLPALLDTLTQSLNSAFESTPKVGELIQPPKDGVSLLDVKNELLLSYLQNLVFLILLKIRNAKNGQNETPSNGDPNGLPDTVVKKLVELRLYLDQGVRPLEEKLRFQLDKILRAADDAERAAAQAANGVESESSDDDGDSAEDSDADSINGAQSRGPKPKPLGSTGSSANLLYHPSGGSFLKPSAPAGMAAQEADKDNKTGVYRPPKIAPTSMPTTDDMTRGPRRERRPGKSATMDEYVAEELSSAPMAQPSVGTTIVQGGRATKTAAQRADEDRRREFEENNFTRLPKESKKDRKKREAGEPGSRRMQFGGEDWRELGEGVDRISRLTQQSRGGGGKGTRALLEKSRKRGRDTTDSARGSGFNSGTREIGERFNKKLKVMEGGRRDRGKR